MEMDNSIRHLSHLCQNKKARVLLESEKWRPTNIQTIPITIQTRCRGNQPFATNQDNPLEFRSNYLWNFMGCSRNIYWGGILDVPNSSIFSPNSNCPNNLKLPKVF